MQVWELFLIGVGLSMDAFAVAMCKGLALGRPRVRQAALIALFFGGFQALMPTLGYLLGRQFERYIVSLDHWIAFALLGVIGGKMIYESLKGEQYCPNASLRLGELAMLALATSIDALAVGVTFAFLQVNIGFSAALIGATTFALSLSGVYLGSLLGGRAGGRAEFVGGSILVLIGLKILLEHLGVIAF